MPSPSSIKEVVTDLAGTALRAFVGAFLRMLALCLLVLVVAVVIAAPGGVRAAILLGLFVLALGAFLSWSAAIRGAVSAALIAGWQKMQLGSRTMRLLFERILAMDEHAEAGDRDRGVAAPIERLPLVEAESRLRRAVNTVLGETAQHKGIRGALARRIEASALRRVEALTLRAFHDEEDGAGVDLVKVRDALAEGIDAEVEERLRGIATRSAYLAAAAMIAIPVACAFFVRFGLG